MLRLIFWPFRLVFGLWNALFRLTGRLVMGIIGSVLLCTGIILTLTIVGSVAGIPLALLGLSFCLRALF